MGVTSNDSRQTELTRSEQESNQAVSEMEKELAEFDVSEEMRTEAGQEGSLEELGNARLPVNPQRLSIASSDDALLVTVGRTPSAEAVSEGEAVHTEPEVVAVSGTVVRV